VEQEIIFCYSLGFDETLFTTVIKTLTLHPRRGNLRWYNPLGCIRLIPGGTVNAVGLTNPGIDWWCHEIGPFIDSSEEPVLEVGGRTVKDDENAYYRPRCLGI